MSNHGDWVGEERRQRLDPDDARAVLAALVQHLESEDYLSRALQELRGTVGSVSGELGQMKEALVSLQQGVAILHKLVANLQTAQKLVDEKFTVHLQQAEPIIEASEAFMVLARAGKLLWRLKWWAAAAVVLAWTAIRGDWPAVLRAINLLGGLHLHG